MFRSGCTGRGLDTRLGLLLVALTEFIWGVGCWKKYTAILDLPLPNLARNPNSHPDSSYSRLHPNNCDQKPATIWGVIAFFFFFLPPSVSQLPPFHRSVPAPSQSVAGGAINPHGKQSREKKEHKVRWTNNIYHLIISPCSDQSEAPYQTTCQNLSVGVRSRSSGDLIVAGHVKGLYKRHVSVFYGLIVNQTHKTGLNCKKKSY